MTFPVRLSALSALDVTIDYATVDENGTACEDYQPASGTIFIPAGTTLSTILVDINDDALDEEHERFAVVLSRPVNARLYDFQGEGIIKDNDEPPMLIKTGKPPALPGRLSKFDFYGNRPRHCVCEPPKFIDTGEPSWTIIKVLLIQNGTVRTMWCSFPNIDERCCMGVYANI
jgi:hypothetical protein